MHRMRGVLARSTAPVVVRTTLFACVVGLIMALPNVARGEQPPTIAPRHEVSLGVTSAFYVSNHDYSPTAKMLDVAYHFRPSRPGIWKSMRFTEGFRIGATDDNARAFELYGRAELIANVGPWTPTLGPEFGVSSLGLRFLRFPGPFPNDWTDFHEKRLGFVYVAFVATPLRFTFWRLTVSAFELSLGGPVIGLGAVNRFQVGLLHVGGTL